MFIGWKPGMLQPGSYVTPKKFADRKNATIPSYLWIGKPLSFTFMSIPTIIYEDAWLNVVE